MTLEGTRNTSLDVLDEAAQVAEDALPAKIVSKGMSAAHAKVWLKVADSLYKKLGRPLRPDDFVDFASRIVTDPANTRAIRAYEKAGFEKVRMVDTPDGPALLMTRNA